VSQCVAILIFYEYRLPIPALVDISRLKAFKTSIYSCLEEIFERLSKVNHSWTDSIKLTLFVLGIRLMTSFFFWTVSKPYFCCSSFTNWSIFLFRCCRLFFVGVHIYPGGHDMEVGTLYVFVLIDKIRLVAIAHPFHQSIHLFPQDTSHFMPL